ncbi:hypothetical protein BU15DRAFT_67623 [Melanogaster broomeanus]|nr:hypothetical protein BU15DRAFT_67623 [Melanogaster broomeanus]
MSSWLLGNHVASLTVASPPSLSGGGARVDTPATSPARGLKMVKAMQWQEPSSHPKPTKIIQQYTAEWSEDEPNSEDADNDWSPATTMWSVGDSVILTIDKREFTFSGEAPKKAQMAYQPGHMPLVSQGVRHFGDSQVTQLHSWRIPMSLIDRGGEFPNSLNY